MSKLQSGNNNYYMEKEILYQKHKCLLNQNNRKRTVKCVVFKTNKIR